MPPEAPKAAPETFEAVAKDFLKRHVEKQKLRSSGEIERQFNRYIYPAWRAEPFASIRRSKVVELLDAIEDNSGPVMADRVLATLRKLFNWREVRDEDYSSPIVRGMRVSSAKDRARKRILSDDEIRALWADWSTAGTFGAFLQTCLLTAQRRGKVLSMRWGDLKDGVWTIKALLTKAGGDIEKQLAKAVKFQSVFDDLKQRTDPVGFAMQQLGREAEALKKIFAEAGAGAAEYAQLEQLLALKRADAAKDAGGAAKALKDFLLDLNAGPGSPLSLRQQKIEAEAAFAPYSAAIASAQAARAQADAIKASGGSADAIGAAEQAARLAAGKIDQEGFQSAAQRLLGITRAGDASGAGFFAEFDRIRALTQTGIGLIDRPVDLTPQIAQNTADTANLLVDATTLLKSIDARLSVLNDNGVLTGDWFAANRSFVA